MNVNIADLSLYKSPEDKKALCDYYLTKINEQLDLLSKLFIISSEETKSKNIELLNGKIKELETYNG